MHNGDADESDCNFHREEQLERDMEREPFQRVVPPTYEEGLEKSAMIGQPELAAEDEWATEVNEADAQDVQHLRLGIYGEG